MERRPETSVSWPLRTTKRWRPAGGEAASVFAPDGPLSKGGFKRASNMSVDVPSMLDEEVTGVEMLISSCCNHPQKKTNPDDHTEQRVKRYDSSFRVFV